MSYFKTQWERLCQALKRSSFWSEVLILIPISMLGIWWPVWFDWTGYDKYLIPAAWFTFGLGSLATIFLQRCFMSETLDDYKNANMIFVALFSIIGAMFYGKALVLALDNKELVILFMNFNILEVAIILNIFVWIWNLISRGCFDRQSAGNPLGESHD